MGSVGQDDLSGLLEVDPGLPVPNPTQAFWQSPAHSLANIQSNTFPGSADVVIIGSGITGCSVAKALLETDSTDRLVVLEARTLTSGATGRNGGHLTSAAVADYRAESAEHGKIMATKMANFTFRTIERIHTVVESYGEPLKQLSEIRRVERLDTCFDDYINGAAEDLVLFEKDMPEHGGRQHVIKVEDLPTADKLPGSTGAVTGPGGALWPYRLVTYIFEQLLEKYPSRLSIETSTPAISIVRDQHTKNYTIDTPRGPITATKVIHCTNGYASHLLPGLRGGLFPIKGNMSVQKRGTTFPNQGETRSWSFHHEPHLDPKDGTFAPGLYYMTQNAHTGDIYIGGEKETLPELLNTDDSRLGPNSSENLKGILPKFFGDCGWAETNERVRSLWSGVMGFTSDGQPLVGRIPSKLSGRGTPDEDGEEWMAVGYNGYGMPKAWLCGEAVVAMIRGGQESEAIKKWLPEAYLLTEDRLAKLNSKQSIAKLFAL